MGRKLDFGAVISTLHMLPPELWFSKNPQSIKFVGHLSVRQALIPHEEGLGMEILSLPFPSSPSPSLLPPSSSYDYFITPSKWQLSFLTCDFFPV